MPHFTKDLKAARKPINARCETAASSGMFRVRWPRGAASFPTDASYEWRAVADGKQPYAIARRDGAPLALAGLWESWRSPEGKTLRTFAILTTAANAIMAQLHERMPVVLEQRGWPPWLGEAGEGWSGLMRRAADDVLRLWASVAP